MGLAHIASTVKGTAINGGATDPIDTTGADLLVVSVSWHNPAGDANLSDSKGNTWTPLTKSATSTAACRIWYCRGGSVGPGHTFTSNVGGSFPTIYAAAFSGAAASPFHVENGSTGTSIATLAAGSVTTPEGNCLVFAAVATNPGTAHAVGGGFGGLFMPFVTSQYYGGGGARLNQVAAGAVNPTFTWTTNAGAAARVAVFRSADPASTPITSARVSQAGAEVLSAGAPAARVSQSGAEVLSRSAPSVRLTQSGAEVLRRGSTALLSQEVAEVLRDGRANVLASQAVAEVLHGGTLSTAQLSQGVTEVLRSTVEATPFTDFCCRSGGSNLNAGTVDGASVEPSVAPLAAYTGGSWDSATDVYTAPAGADLSEALTGRYASLYHDGAAVPTTNQFLVARIVGVDVAARKITLSTTCRALLGTEVATGVNNRTLRIGGAWAGMAGANWFPFTLPLGNLTSAGGGVPRLNLKNDQTYAMTAGFTASTATVIKSVCGYAFGYGDGGRAVIDGGVAGASFSPLRGSASYTGASFRDVEFKDNGATGTAPLVNVDSAVISFYRCVFRGGRGQAIFNNITGGTALCHECEFFGNCLGTPTFNSVIHGSFSAAVVLLNCIIRNNPSYGASVSGTLVAANCIVAANNSYGLIANAPAANVIVNCDVYNNGNDGLLLDIHGVVIKNCNVLKNAGYGLGTGPGNPTASAYHTGFGSGSFANVAGTVEVPTALNNTGPVIYAAGVTPWANPDGGDFRIDLAAASGTGRGQFLDTTGSHAATVGYPDIGAASPVPPAAETYTAAAVLVTSSVTLTGSASFESLTYTAIADLVTGHVTLTGIAAFAGPGYTADAVLVTSPVTLTGTATAAVPGYTGSADLVTGAVTLTGTAAARSVYTAAADLVVGAITLEGAATFVAPIYTATAELLIGAVTLTGSAQVTDEAPPKGIFSYPAFPSMFAD